MEIKTRLATFAPPTSWDEVYDVDLSCPTSGLISFNAYLDCTIDGVSNMWWLRATRDRSPALMEWPMACGIEDAPTRSRFEIRAPKYDAAAAGRSGAAPFSEHFRHDLTRNHAG